MVPLAPARWRAEVCRLALEAARAVPAREDYLDRPARGEAPTELIPLLDEAVRPALLDEAVAATQTIDDTGLRLRFECAMLDALPSEGALAVLER